MSFLTVSAIEIPIQATGADQDEPLRIGEQVPAFSGRLRSSVRAVKRRWSFTTGPMTAAEVTTLESAIALDAEVTCAGDALGGSVTCQVRITRKSYLQDSSQASDFSWILTLQLAEV